MKVGEKGLASLRPVRLPRVRERLARHWISEFRRFILGMPATATFYMPGYLAGRPDQFAALVTNREVDTRDVDRFCRRIGDGVEDAEMYWISREFGELATAAGESLPDFDILPEELPAPNGLMVYEQLAWRNNTDADALRAAHPDYDPLPVHAISWVTLPTGVWVNIYSAPELTPGLAGAGMSAELVRAKIGYLMPHAPGGGAPFGADVNQANPGTIMRIVFATWFLIMQPGVADEELGPVDKAEKRKADRAGLRYPKVRVINLRHAPGQEGGESSAGGRSFHVRWMVKGHWRKQFYGPGRAKRRRMFIAPFMKGPAGAPLKAPAPTVHKLS